MLQPIQTEILSPPPTSEVKHDPRQGVEGDTPESPDLVSYAICRDGLSRKEAENEDYTDHR